MKDSCEHKVLSRKGRKGVYLLGLEVSWRYNVQWLKDKVSTKESTKY